MEKWEAEIKDILAKQNREPQPDWEDFFKQIMPLMEMLTFMALGGAVIHSPEGRRQLKEALLKKGWPPEKADRVLYTIIENSTRIWEKGNGRRGCSNNQG